MNCLQEVLTELLGSSQAFWFGVTNVNVHRFESFSAGCWLDAARAFPSEEDFGARFNLNVLQIGAAWTFHFLLDVEGGHSVLQTHK